MSAPLTIAATLASAGLAKEAIAEAKPGDVALLARRCACGNPMDRRYPQCTTCWDAQAKADREAAAIRSLPEIHRGCRFGTKELAHWCGDKEAIKRAREFVVDFPPVPMVTIWGETRAGKSALASAVAIAVRVRHRRPFLFVDARDLGRARAECGFGHEPELLRKAKSIPVLVIDELGKESELVRANPEDVVCVITERLRRQLLTICTTEWSPLEHAPNGKRLHDIYAPSVVQRLTERWSAGPPPKGCALVIEVQKK